MKKLQKMLLLKQICDVFVNNVILPAWMSAFPVVPLGRWYPVFCSLQEMPLPQCYWPCKNPVELFTIAWVFQTTSHSALPKMGVTRGAIVKRVHYLTVAGNAQSAKRRRKFYTKENTDDTTILMATPGCLNVKMRFYEREI
jgi:hypothetical protein